MATLNTLGKIQGQAKDSIANAAAGGISFGPTGTQQAKEMSQAATGTVSTSGAGAAASNIAEQQAVADVAEQQKELQQAAAGAEIQQANEEENQYLQLQDQELDTRNQALRVRQEFNSQVTKLLTDFKNKGDELDLSKSKAQVEQISALLRLQDDKYVNNLKLEGSRRRLQSKAAFAEAAMEDQFRAQTQLLKDDYAFKSLLKAEGRDFETRMQNLGYDQALEILDAEMEASKSAQTWRATGSLLETAIQAGERFAGQQEESGISTTGEQLAQSGVTLREETNTQGVQPSLGNYTYTPTVQPPNVSPVTGLPYTFGAK